MAQLKRVTMQDIAAACGLSRNTVSKIFNGRGTVPDSTRELVLAKAQELGYIQMPVETAETATAAPAAVYRNIALLTHSRPSMHNFGSQFITNFTDQICRSGYNLKIFEINDEAYAQMTLPAHFAINEISGIIIIELFDRDYTQMICNLGVPVLLIDSYAAAPGDLMQCDRVYMENYASTIALTSQMIKAGAKTIGFVGDINHCCSFRERWNGFCAAMMDAGLTVDRSVCILEKDSLAYGELDWMVGALNKLSHIPDGFVCCNDYVAIHVMRALRQKGLSIPEDVMVTGFDGTLEAEVVDPPLTTAKIPTADIGRISADIMLEHIDNPELPCRCVVVGTTPLWRASTRM